MIVALNIRYGFVDEAASHSSENSKQNYIAHKFNYFLFVLKHICVLRWTLNLFVWASHLLCINFCAMNELCEDTQRLVVEYCNDTAISALSKTSTIWPELIKTSKLSFVGPVNGHTFSSETFKTNGPCVMPYVITIIIDDHGLIDGLNALQIESLKAYKTKSLKLILHLSVLDDAYCAFIRAHEWASVVVLHNSNYQSNFQDFIKIKTKKVVAMVTDFFLFQIDGLEHLVLSGFQACSYAQEFNRLFDHKLHTLRLFGVLTDEAINYCATRRMPTLKNLFLHNEAVCNWHNASVLQLMFPNLESFALRISNIVRSDLPNFKFDLWPNLKGLNLERNHTLDLTNYEWPKGLESLRIVDCTFSKFLDVGPQLKDLSISCVPGVFKELSAFLALKCPRLEVLYVSFKDFCIDYEDNLESFRNLAKITTLSKIDITFYEKFDISVQRLLAKVRSLCPNALVKTVLY